MYVVLYHTLWAALPGMTHESTAGRILSFGYLSVGFFFFLSGYILSIVYLRADRHIDRRSFYVARFARVYPLFFLTLVGGTPFLFVERVQKYGLTTGMGKTALTFLANIVMLQAWIPILRGIDNPNWSLSVETLFYLVFPILGAWIWRLKGSRIWITGVVVWIASQALVQVACPHLSTSVGEFNPILHLGTFTLGIVLARWQAQRRSNFGASPANSTSITLALAFAAICFPCIVVLSPYAPNIWLGDGMLVPLFAAIIWACSDNRGLPARLLSASWLVVLGEASYGLYLIHFPAYQLYLALGMDRIRALYPVYLAACIGLSVCSLYWVEIPTRKWLLKRLHARPKETMEVASDAQ